MLNHDQDLAIEILSLNNDDIDFKVTYSSYLVGVIELQELTKLFETQAIPGFRPGHAPVQHLRLEARKRFGKARYLQVVREWLMSRALEKIQHDVEHAILPGSERFRHETQELMKPELATVELEFTIDRGAEIIEGPELGRLKTTELMQHRLSSEFVTNQMWIQYRAKAPLQELDDEPCTKQDLVTVKFEYLEGERRDGDLVRVDMSKDHNRERAPWIDLIKVQCLNLPAGEVVRLENQRVPDNWPKDPEWRGKVRDLEITILKIERPVMEPDLDDEVAQDLGFKDLAEWTEMVRQDLQHTVEGMNLDLQREAVYRALTSCTKFHISLPAINMLVGPYIKKLLPMPHNDEEAKQYSAQFQELCVRMLKDLEQESEQLRGGKPLPKDALLPMLEKQLAHELLRRYVMERWSDEPGQQDLVRVIMEMSGIKNLTPEHEARAREFLKNPEQQSQTSQVFRLKNGITNFIAHHATSFTIIERDLET